MVVSFRGFGFPNSCSQGSQFPSSSILFNSKNLETGVYSISGGKGRALLLISEVPLPQDFVPGMEVIR